MSDNTDPIGAAQVQRMAERKMSALYSGRKRSSGAGAHVTFKIGGANTTEELAVLHEKPDQSKVNDIDESEQEKMSLLHNEDEKPSDNDIFSSNSDSSSEFNSISRDNSFLPLSSVERNVFVELYDLKLNDEKNLDGCWDETARWVKYEEDVEGVDHRWGQPHVAFLSMSSMLQLRKCVSKGIVLLDSKATCFTEVCEQIAKAMVHQGHCVMDTKRIIDILTLKHNHVPDRDRKMSRITSVLFDRPSDEYERRPQRTHSAVPLHHHTQSSTELQSTTSHLSACPTSPSNLLPYVNDDFNSKVNDPLLQINSPYKHSIDESLGTITHKRSISSFVNKFRRNFSKPMLDDDSFVTSIPEGTETAQVFAGAIKELTKVRFVMLRLQNPTFMPEIVERPIPVRFVFLILGPQLHGVSYHELGRAISTTICNKDFNSFVYNAKSSHELLSAIDAFLHGSILIPPGEIDNKRLLSGDEIKKALKRCNLDNMGSKQKEDINHNHASNGVRPMANGHSTEIHPAKEKKFRFFGGMLDDLIRRYPQYKSDITDAFNFQCLTSIVFMFFASFAPAITFGGLLGKYTEEKIGMIETLFAQCFCGIIWGLFACQPMLIMSATGPVLIFEASLYATCKTLGLDFLVIRLYAGIWILLISIIIVSVDGSKLLKYVTRFTEDIFATLISTIFIAESLHFIYDTFLENPVENFIYYEKIHASCGNASGVILPNMNFTPMRTFPNLTKLFKQEMSLVAKRGIVVKDGEDPMNKTVGQATAALTNILNNSDLYRSLMSTSNTSTHEIGSISCIMAEPNTALLTAIILFATFSLAFLLKKLRESFYLGRHLRRAIGDFGVLISIAIVASIVALWIPDPYLQRLDMPDHLNFTNPVARGHGLLVMISWESFSQNWYGVFVALIAALLVLVLLFVETEITELLLLRKEKGCRKGGGMDFDLILLAICCLFCSMFGLPWMCAAVLQSLSHCSSLTVFKKKPPGAKAEVDFVIEQRLTTICVSILIGLIAFAGSYLRLPLASLFGVFLYLGVMNLCGIQLIERIVLFFIPEKYFPTRSYTQDVSFWRLNMYTLIQIILLVFIFMVKHYKRTALAFPFVLILFIAFRQFIMPLIFSDKELNALDGEEDEGSELDWTEKDLYHVPIPV